MATGGWPDLSPLAVGVDRGHPQWSDLSSFFFFFLGLPEKSLEMAVGGSVCLLDVTVGDGSVCLLDVTVGDGSV
jgi:hypothetical protein